MENILVLTDHSFSSFNAARYALKYAATFENSKVVYYHSYNFFVHSADDIPMDYSDIDSVKDASLKKMEDFESSLEPFRGEGTLVESISDSHPLLDGIHEIISEYNVNLIVAGSKNRTALGRLLIGSQLLNVIENAGISVLVIPPSYNYEPVATAVLATDLTGVDKLPIDSIKGVIENYHCRLLILNVNSEKEEHTDIDQILSIGKLHRLLDVNRPDFHYVNSQAVCTGISEFCDIHHAGLLILLHKEHSFLHRLFYRSVERDMIVHSNVPLLILTPLDKSLNRET